MNQSITTHKTAIAASAITDGSQVLAHDGYDVQEFSETVTTFPKLARTVNEADQQLCTGTALLRDLYWSFHKATPRLASTPVTPVHEINQQIMAEIMSTAEWRELRELGTIGDAFASALATTGAGEKAIATLGNDTMDMMNQLAESLQELSQFAKEPEKATQLNAQSEAAQGQAEQKISSAEQLKHSLNATREPREQSVRQAARQGLRNALQEIEQVNDAAEAFGNSAGFSSGARGIHHRHETREKLNLAEAKPDCDGLRSVQTNCLAAAKGTRQISAR